MRRLPAFLRRFAAAAAAAFIVASSPALAEEPLRVAAILPLSGPVASLGTYVQKGIALAYERLPEERRRAVELVFEDDQFDPKQTVSAYQHLLSKGPIDAVVVMASPTANALAPITERNGDVLVAIGASDPDIVKSRRFAFIHWVIPPVLGEALADALVKKGYERFAFVSAEVSGALADRDAATAALRARGVGERIVYDQSFEKGQLDYRTAIAAIRAKRADAVIVALFPGALSAFAKQAKQSGLEAELIGMETFEDEAEVKAAEGALTGAWYVNAADPTPAFVELYRAKYNEHPGWAAANAYDTLNLIAESAAENRSAEHLRLHLSSVKDYEGGAGRYSASGDNRFTLPPALKRVTKDGFVTLP